MFDESKILIKIPDNDLPKLWKLYKEKAPWASHISTFVDTVIKLKKSEESKNVVTIYSPYNSWKQDGTIIAHQDVANSLYVFTFDPECKTLQKALEFPIYDYSKIVRWFGLHAYHFQIVENHINKYYKLEEDYEFLYYIISSEEAKKFTIECPPDMYIKTLDETNTPQIKKILPYQFDSSEIYINLLLKVNVGFGLFQKSTNQLVAWIVEHIFGLMCILQVEEEFQGKGYGSLITKVLSKKIGEQGNDPTVIIYLTNYPSRRTFEKLGFRQNGFARSLFSIKK